MSGLPESNEDLEWYYQYSAADVGLHSPNLGGVPVTSPEPPTPSAAQLEAARRQNKIRRALAELSPTLQSVLEACYEPRPHSVQLRHEHGIAAGLVARHVKEEGLQIEVLYSIVAAAHEAFLIAYGKPARTREERAQRWLSEELER
jgi:hypothetical protein